MKFLVMGILALISSSVSAQAFTKEDFANLLTQRRLSLEMVNPGMSKQVSTTARFLTEFGSTCTYTQTSLQTVLKIEGPKLIILSDETFSPEATPACAEAGLTSFQEKILFYEDKPSLEVDLADLQESDVRSLYRVNEIVTMTVNGILTNEDGPSSSELVTLKYDLTKPAFKNLIFTQAGDYTTTVTDIPDRDVYMMNLSDVVFCASSDPEEADCIQGDFSDILF